MVVMKFKNNYFPFAYVVLLSILSSCGNKIDTKSFYGSVLKTVKHEEGRDTAGIVATSGDVRVREDDFLYQLNDNLVLDKNDLRTFSQDLRKVLLKKAVLRRLAIQEGIGRDLFADEAAARYILPRFEKMLEEYYYRRAANYDAIFARVKSIAPDETVMQAYIEKQSKKSQVDPVAIRAERDRLLRSIAEKRLDEEKLKIIDELLAKNPSIEIRDGLAK